MHCSRRTLLLGSTFGALASAQAPRRLRLCTAAFPPFRIVQADGRVVGSDADIVRSVLERLGWQVEIEALPLRRALLDAAQGQACAGFLTFTRNPERETQFVFSAAISSVQDVLFKRQRDAIRWRELADLAPWRVGYSAAYNYAPAFMQALAEKRFVGDPVTTTEPEIAHLRKLARGHIDLALCERSVCNHLLREHAAEFIDQPLDFIDRTVGTVRSFHVGWSRAWPGVQELAERFDQELARFDREGGRRAIFQRYGMQVSLP